MVDLPVIKFQSPESFWEDMVLQHARMNGDEGGHAPTELTEKRGIETRKSR